MDWLALVAPPLLWAKALYASPFARTQRRRLSFTLAVLTGLLMFWSLRVDDESFLPVFVAGCLALLAMAVSLFWKAGGDKPDRDVR